MKEIDLARQAYRRLKLESKFPLQDASEFVNTGRSNLELLKDCGLLPHHVVLDHDCRYMNTGWWLLRYLYDYKYFAIKREPPESELLTRTLLQGMSDRVGGIRDTTDCTFSLFNLEFDCVFSDRLWSGLGFNKVLQCMDSFLKHSKPGAFYLTSVLLTQGSGMSGEGENYVNAAHNEKDLRSEVALRGLKYSKLDIERDDNYSWLLLQRAL